MGGFLHKQLSSVNRQFCFFLSFICLIAWAKDIPVQCAMIVVKTTPHSHNLSYLFFFLNLGVYQFYWFFFQKLASGFIDSLSWVCFLLHYFLHFISSFYFVLWFLFGFLGWETGYWFATFLHIFQDTLFCFSSFSCQDTFYFPMKTSGLTG